VWLRLDEDERNTLSIFEQIKIAKGNYLIPVSELVDWSYSNAELSIKHFNGARQISIEASNAFPDQPISEVIEEIEHRV